MIPPEKDFFILFRWFYLIHKQGTVNSSYYLETLPYLVSVFYFVVKIIYYSLLALFFKKLKSMGNTHHKSDQTKRISAYLKAFSSLENAK